MKDGSKTAQVAELLRNGNVREALAVGKSFRLGLTPARRALITRGAECFEHSRFYADLGFDPDDCIRIAVAVLGEVVGVGEPDLATSQGGEP